MRPFLLVLIFSLTACGKVEIAEINEVVKQSVDAMRAKERVVIQVRLEKSELPTDEQLAGRRKLEEEIEIARIGRVTETNAGVGYYDITVEVDSTAEAIPRIESMLRDAGVKERAVVRVAGRN